MARIQTFTVVPILLLAGCSSGPRRIVVGSKNFTESILLGEIVAAQLERKLGQPVDRKLNLGGTLLAHQALVSGAIDLYPEYTGTALTTVLKEAPPNDRGRVFAQVAKAYEERWHVRWLPPLGFNNTFAMLVRSETARAGGLATISDAARRPQPWRLAAGYEFLQRPDCLGLLSTYNLRLDGQPVSMDLGLVYQALEGKQVDMAAAGATDGQLGILDVVVLADDKHYFPPYECAVLVREPALAGYPGMLAALAKLSGKIGDAAMRRMNRQVEGEHRPVRDVAAEFLDRLSNGAGE
jgi:glycine betaine/choline ABC-type transport system substrate-binding protein